MKLSITLALALAGSASADIIFPAAPFVTQCCMGAFTGVHGEWERISGMTGDEEVLPRCASLGAGLGELGLQNHAMQPDFNEQDPGQSGQGVCLSADETCAMKNTMSTTNPPFAIVFHACTYNSGTGDYDADPIQGLECCNTADPNRGPLDMVWTCANMLGGEQVSNGHGYYCGGQEDCKLGGVVCGDPHFQTWDEEWFDFHGECDLVFVKDPEFGNGLGLNIHLRATQRYEYSFIEAAAIKIGDDVLQVSAYGDYIFNGVEKAAMPNKFADQVEVTYHMSDKKNHIFEIDLPGKDSIKITTFKDLVAVKMGNATERTFGRSTGLLGDYRTGEKLGRDGKTVITDDIEFGMEWQVREDEPMLFETARAPQFPAKCVMPTKSASAERRRLGEGVSKEAAEAACAATDHIHHDNCVYDVMATGDLEIALAGVF